MLIAIAEHRVEGDTVLHEHHAAGFADGGFTGIEFDLHILHFFAEQLIVDYVCHGIPDQVRGGYEVKLRGVQVNPPGTTKRPAALGGRPAIAVKFATSCSGPIPVTGPACTVLQRRGFYPSAMRTSSAMASDAVSPGDSMP